MSLQADQGFINEIMQLFVGSEASPVFGVQIYIFLGYIFTLNFNYFLEPLSEFGRLGRGRGKGKV